MVRVYAFTRDTFRRVYLWNQARMIEAYGPVEGERRFRELPAGTAYTLWRTEGPGRLDIH